MNLTEAAEIVRNKATCNGTVDGILKVGEAYKILYDTMLFELDPTLISEEWLREDGWEKREDDDFTRGQFVLRCDNKQAWWATVYLPPAVYLYPIKTIGELRTLLRLMGGGE